MLVRTQPRREDIAVEWIAKQRQGCECYLPKFLDPRDQKIKILFPSYLFVFTPGPWYFLKGTFGVSSIHMSGDQPAHVLQREITRLKRKESENGIIHMKDLELQLGQEVTITFGPLKGQVGEYDGTVGSERVRVLLSWLASAEVEKRHIRY